jgi:hypothetical protein
MGMQACAPALAEVVGLEVASEQSSAGIFSNLGDIQSGFASAFLLIFFSEIGDKTFFIAVSFIYQQHCARHFNRLMLRDDNIVENEPSGW